MHRDQLPARLIDYALKDIRFKYRFSALARIRMALVGRMRWDEKKVQNVELHFKNIIKIAVEKTLIIINFKFLFDEWIMLTSNDKTI